MSHRFNEDINALAASVRAGLVSLLPSQDHSEERHYQYTDPQTERMFEIRRLEGLDDAGNPTIDFFLNELIPNGVLVQTNKEGQVIKGWEEPAIKEAEARFGPNGQMQALRDAGIDTSAMVRMGSGLGTGTLYYRTLEACAEEIAKALAANCRYRSFVQLTEQQKVQLERRSAIESHAYWKSQGRTMEAALASEQGIFKGCHTGLGKPLSDETKEAILGYLNKPSQERWLEIRGFIVTGVGTLWQAWCVNDPQAPRSGDEGYPSKDALTSAIEAAVAAREKEIVRRRQGTTPSGLRAV